MSAIRSARWSARHEARPVRIFMHYGRTRRMLAHAADRVFLGRRGAGILVRCARRTGLPPLTVKLVAGHGTGRKRKPRPVCRKGSRAGSGTALCLETLDGLGPGHGNPESSGGTLTPTGGRAADRRGGGSWGGIGRRGA